MRKVISIFNLNQVKINQLKQLLCHLSKLKLHLNKLTLHIRNLKLHHSKLELHFTKWKLLLSQLISGFYIYLEAFVAT